MNIVLVGAGAWGKNYISTLKNFPEVNLIVATRKNWKQLIDNNPNGVIIATPPDSHIEIASYALQKNIAVMIEKPLALSLDEVKKIEEFNAPILVNHIQLFTEAYKQLKNIVDNKYITKITSYGCNDSAVREYSSLWDYGCHDIALILDLTKTMPLRVCAEEICKENTGKSIFSIDMTFERDNKKDYFETQSYVGNGSEFGKCRQLEVEFDGISVSYDDENRPIYHTLPLQNAIQVFLDAIKGKYDYRLGLDLSIKVIKVMELCQEYINNT